jgi:hypothetical protein
MTENMIKAAMAGLTAYHAGLTGVTPLEQLPAAVWDATAPYEAAELMLPVLAVTLAAAQLAAQARGVTVETILADLGADVATFEG